MFRFACIGACLVMTALAGPALAAGGCGVGCYSTSEGACVRDGWLADEAKRLREQADLLPPGELRDAVERKARRAERLPHI
jgi:hypothetical protein